MSLTGVNTWGQYTATMMNPDYGRVTVNIGKPYGRSMRPNIGNPETEENGAQPGDIAVVELTEFARRGLYGTVREITGCFLDEWSDDDGIFMKEYTTIPEKKMCARKVFLTADSRRDMRDALSEQYRQDGYLGVDTVVEDVLFFKKGGGRSERNKWETSVLPVSWFTRDDGM